MRGQMVSPGSVFAAPNSINHGLIQSLKLSFLSTEHSILSRGNRFGLTDPMHPSQNVTPSNLMMVVRDDEENTAAA